MSGECTIQIIDKPAAVINQILRKRKHYDAGMTTLMLTIITVLVFFTSLLSGIFGIAGGLLLMGGLLVLLPVAPAMVAHGVLQLIGNGSRVVLGFRYVHWRLVGRCVLGGALAMAVLAALAYQPQKAWIFLGMGLFGIIVWLPLARLGVNLESPLHGLLCGAIAGGLTILIGVAGPTLDAFFASSGRDRRTIIATKAMVQVASHSAKIIFYGAPLWAGWSPTGALALWLIPIVSTMLGTMVGNQILERMSDRTFLTWVRVIVTVVATGYAIKGGWLLLN